MRVDCVRDEFYIWYPDAWSFIGGQASAVDRECHQSCILVLIVEPVPALSSPFLISSSPPSLPHSGNFDKMTMSTPKANTNTSPAPRRWQTQPVPGSHHVLGYLMTKSMTRPFCDKYCPLPEDASEREEEIHFRSMRSYLPQLLPPEYGLENLESVLVYVDKKRMSMARLLEPSVSRPRSSLLGRV
ncbi:hypothetical protein GLOTRDRAFT_134338 [Gloeophyllum trabeum ATCC 11539]|uniref:Uncharacterized protein n=1 Tax=Gloeophyllum trabeum (strain ATCC 11539 / FP-39264 / Madison 617) TaxID=670483 RepID=S7PRL6_GLOTA|nr:uncharacterized protein GLOTRDRAFT_134338 [Gloeophyllum trabeum ATCC 11539]EPQ50018.1 hypothetical protein GLOTRDRAFT_134338 [Gloeophyllum trabeum ATCC 11539]